MKNNDLRKAKQYFNDAYGHKYENASKLLDFGFSTLPRIIQYSELSSDAKVCLSIMMDLKYNNELPDPQLYYSSQKRIAFLAGGLSLSAVSRALSSLEKAELIGKIRLGQGKQNVYCLLEPPEEFISNAIKRRAIVGLIHGKKMDWTDIDTNGDVIIRNEQDKKVVETLINNEICIYANQDSRDCKSRFPNQASRNLPGAVPALDASYSEVSSVELTSEELSSDKDKELINNDILQKKDFQQHPIVNSSLDNSQTEDTGENVNPTSEEFPSNPSECRYASSETQDNSEDVDRQPSIVPRAAHSFLTLITQFQNAMKKGVKQATLNGMLTELLEKLGVEVKKKNGDYNYSVAGKGWKLKKGKILEVLYLMYQKKTSGELNSPTGYWHKVVEQGSG